MTTQKKILIAEDEKPIRDILWNKLKEAGYEPSICTDGEECMLVAKEQKPDLLLLDIVMPKKDGLEVLKEFSTAVWAKDIPIIVLTNRSDYTTQHTAWSFGAKIYLVKAETSLEEVISRVKEVLG